ncbi:disease resistance protein RGA5-like [Triticum dicoccoides]|uniref:disease resistance protein RGA5-like n=1 Tax=Triticum dicoccoides TaxID=85692 RepID=UPI0018919011|nr:disease resistance protein RGA5-like [Triticum dicoccoides]
MEAALVSAVTGALKPVLEKLATLLGDEYKRLKGVHGEIKFLTDELAAMHAFLVKMSEEGDPDVQDKVWMTAVRELSYDMEDSIDDFMQGADQKDAKPDGFIEKIKSSLGKLGKMKTHHRIGKEIQGLKKQIIEVGQRNARYKNREDFSSTRNATVDPRALAIFEHASKLIGIDEPKCEIIKMLTQDDGVASTQHQIKMVSIVGAGSMGKTTLANQVYQELKGQFECHNFLSVSRNPDMMCILRTILSEVTGQKYGDTKSGSIQQVISKINDFLAESRYLIVVDDIWKEESWDVLKCAFPSSNYGSKIITTTRISNVAHSCHSSFRGHIYNIKPLNMVHSRQLFYGRLFNSKENCPAYLEEVSDQILAKCDGLPLAIIAISGLLANTEQTEHHWNQVKASIGCALERNSSVQRMIKILSLSYFDLPIHLKTCLLYLSIFPEDSVIEKKGLIRRWIGEGFIHKEGRYTTYELGEKYFNELINRSLIQPVEMTRYGNVWSCRVHDTILDFIIFKSIEENFVTLVGVPNLTVGTQNKVRRLAIQVKDREDYFVLSGIVLSHVRSFSLFRGLVEIPSLNEFKHLRVLVLRDCSQMENHHLVNIVGLFQLRYLDLRETDISELPEQIGHLQCLEILDLRWCGLHELPASIVNLERLVNLMVCSKVKFPAGILKMQSLERLGEVGVFKEPLNLLQEVGQLKNLKKLKLCFEFDHHTQHAVASKECKKAVASCLDKLVSQNLRFLEVEFAGDLLEGQFFSTLLSLEQLLTYASWIPQVPKWMGSLVNLRKLRLEVTRLEQEDLCILGALPALLILDLCRTWVNEGTRVRIGGEVGFQCLKQFVYDTGVNFGVDLMFAVGSMSNLEKLYLSFLAIKGESFDFGIENLPRLITIRCNACSEIGADVDLKAAMERAARMNPNHPTILYDGEYDAVGSSRHC